MSGGGPCDFSVSPSLNKPLQGMAPTPLPQNNCPPTTCLHACWLCVLLPQNECPPTTCLHACWLVCFCVCLLMGLLASMIACFYACLLPCLLASMLACFHACWLACFHACWLANFQLSRNLLECSFVECHTHTRTYIMTPWAPVGAKNWVFG